MKRASEKRIAVGQGSTLGMTQQTAGSVAKSAVQAKFAKVENAKRVQEILIATGNRLTHFRILLTVGSAVTSAV